MKKLFYIITIILISFSIVSCEKPVLMGRYCVGLKIMVTDKDGNDILSKSSPNYIADKISVTYRGKIYSNMHPTDLGSEMDLVFIKLDSPNRISIQTEVIDSDRINQLPWEKGDQISITMPDGTKHIISYVGKKEGHEDPYDYTFWSFDSAEEFITDYTFVYDPEEQK